MRGSDLALDLLIRSRDVTIQNVTLVPSELELAARECRARVTLSESSHPGLSSAALVGSRVRYGFRCRTETLIFDSPDSPELVFSTSRMFGRFQFVNGFAHFIRDDGSCDGQHLEVRGPFLTCHDSPTPSAMLMHFNLNPPSEPIVHYEWNMYLLNIQNHSL